MRPITVERSRFAQSGCKKHQFTQYRECGYHLVSASRASWATACLGVGGAFLGFGAFGHHNSETDISTLGVFVTWFTGVDTTGIRGVTIPSFKGVEVAGVAGSGWVPLVVDILLGIIVPQLVIVFTIDPVGKVQTCR